MNEPFLGLTVWLQQVANSPFHGSSDGAAVSAMVRCTSYQTKAPDAILILRLAVA
jgi:hypothetical protein